MLKRAVARLWIAAVLSGCTAVSESESTWNPSSEARIRVFHGTSAYLHLGDVCDGTKRPVIHAAAGGFSYFAPNRKIGIPKTSDMPFSYSEYVIPANQPLTIEMYWQAQNASRIWEHCGPIYIRFSPRPGRDYDASMHFENGICRGITLRKLMSDGKGKTTPELAPESGLPFHRCH
jgi:hypothetical protein